MSKGKFDDIGERKEALDKLMTGAPLSTKKQDESPKVTEETVPLQVKIPAAMKRDMRVRAALEGVSQSEYFCRVYDGYHSNKKPVMPSEGEK